MSTTIDNLVALALASGAEVTEQTKFIRITNPSKSKAIYIGKAKGVVTRIDLSGFDTSSLPGVQTLTKEEAREKRLGAVRGQILPKVDQLTKEQVEEAFASSLSRVLDTTEGGKFVPAPKKVKSSPDLINVLE